MVPDWPRLLQGVFFIVLLSAASIYDIRKQVIPDYICIGIALTGLLDFTPNKLAGLLTAVIFWGIALWLGGLDGGDIKFAAAAGLVLGFRGSIAGMILGLAFMLAFHGACILVQNRRGGDMSKSYPLAPFLSLGCLAAYFFI
ncbi:peptidase A24A family protein [Oscillibacter valericigenes Sjm18-20]|nr:peptidase A24A family protein [Oscillibacter valericigenes Sjm18-20]